MRHTEHSSIRRQIVAAGLSLTTPMVLGQSRPETTRQAVIRSDARVITLVTVFTAEAGAMKSLLDVLREGTETFFSRMPGFVSSSVLTARDGRRAINYSQWRSTEDIAAFRADARFAPYIERLRALATLDSLECEVAFVSSV